MFKGICDTDKVYSLLLNVDEIMKRSGDEDFKAEVIMNK